MHSLTHFLPPSFLPPSSHIEVASSSVASGKQVLQEIWGLIVVKILNFANSKSWLYLELEFILV